MDRIQDCPYTQEAQSLAVEAFIPSTKYVEDYERSITHCQAPPQKVVDGYQRDCGESQGGL